MERLLARFRADLLTVERRSENSAATYSAAIGIFLNWLSGENETLDSADARVLSYFLLWRRENGANESTIARDVSALRSFGNYLVRKGIWKENAALFLERPRQTQSIPRVLSVEQVDRLLSTIDITKPLGIRDRALFELIYSCGLRISEACSLLLENLHINEQIVVVLGKGGKERMVPFGESAKSGLLNYLENVRPILAKGKAVPEVFLNYKGNAISRRGIFKEFKKFEKLSGVSAKVHTLRHSFATHLLAGGMDLRSVQELLGHADIATTTIYTHIENSQLREGHERFFPGHSES